MKDFALSEIREAAKNYIKDNVIVTISPFYDDGDPEFDFGDNLGPNEKFKFDVSVENTGDVVVKDVIVTVWSTNTSVVGIRPDSDHDDLLPDMIQLTDGGAVSPSSFAFYEGIEFTPKRRNAYRFLKANENPAPLKFNGKTLFVDGDALGKIKAKITGTLDQDFLFGREQKSAAAVSTIAWAD